MAVGEDGFLDHTKRAMEASKKLQEGIRAIPELQVFGEPHATIMSYGSRRKGIDTYAIADQMEDRGWSVDRQQKPASIHCTVTSNHLRIIDSYLADLRESVAYVKEHPEVASRGNAAMYGMMAKVPFRGMVKHSVGKVMEAMYGPTGQMPEIGKLGEGDDGPLMKAVQRYGSTVTSWLDKLNDARESLFGR
ncbi:MAG: hypothetical protein U0165_15345 [Polyangiaceae bacterium]